VLKSIFTNSFGILTSRVLGLIRDLLTASILGANIFSDIFFVAFKFPNLFRRIFAEGAFTQSFIPAFANSKQKAIFSTTIFLKFLIFLLFFSVIVTLFSKLFTSILAYGFDTQTIDLASPFVAINFYYLPIIFAVTFLASLLQYKKHFAVTAFSTALLNLSLIIALLLSQHLQKIEIVYYLSFGVIIGGILQLIVHLIVVEKKGLCKLLMGGFKAIFQEKKRLANEEEKRFWQDFTPAVFGSSTAHISAFIDTWLASFLVSGSISYLYYANRVFQLPLALFAIATSVVLFPTISKHIRNNRSDEAVAIFGKSFYALLYLLSFATATGMIFAKEIIWLLFERGAFTQNDTINSANVLVMYMIGLVPFGLAKLFSLWLYAHRRQKTSAKISAISLGFNIILSLLLIKPLGASGLALASSLSGILLLILTLKEFGNFHIFKLKYMLLYVVSMVVFVIVNNYLKDYLGHL
jgi:putative peptidoglycan lipid II flippase